MERGISVHCKGDGFEEEKGIMTDEIDDKGEGVSLREEQGSFIHCNRRDNKENREIGTDVGSLVVSTKGNLF